MRRGRRNNKNKDDMFLRLTAVQLTAAVLIFLLLFLLIRRDNGLAERIRTEFGSLMEADWDLTGLFESERQAVFSTDVTDEGICLPAVGNTQPSGRAGQGGIILTAASAADRRTSAAPLTSSFYGEDAPVMPVCGPVTSDYGERIHPITGEESFHSGRDIAADEGTPICAVYDGTVAATGVGELSGNYVKISHGNGIVALYCHCSKLCVSEGDRVRKGDIIAAVGHTGAATGPHLHFEVRIDGELVHPSELLDRAVNAR